MGKKHTYTHAYRKRYFLHAHKNALLILAFTRLAGTSLSHPRAVRVQHACQGRTAASNVRIPVSDLTMINYEIFRGLTGWPLPEMGELQVNFAYPNRCRTSGRRSLDVCVPPIPRFTLSKGLEEKELKKRGKKFLAWILSKRGKLAVVLFLMRFGWRRAPNSRRPYLV